MDVGADTAQIMTKEKKTKLEQTLELLGLSGATMGGGFLSRLGLGALGNRPAKAPSDQELASRLSAAAKRNGIEIRKGKENLGQSFLFPDKDVKKIRDAASKGYKLPVQTPEGSKPLAELMGRKIVWLKGKPKEHVAQLAHEMGHIHHKPMTPNWKLLTYGLPMMSQAAGPAYAFIGAKKAKDPEKARKAGRIGAMISLIGSVPLLAQEALPSIKGMKAMRQQGASRGQVARLGASRMLPMFGSYAMMAAAPALASVLMGRAIARHKSKKDKKK